MPLLDLPPVAIILIATILVGGGIMAIYEYHAAQNSRSRKRLSAISVNRATPGRQDRSGRSNLKNSIDDVLKQLEERRKAGLSGKPTLSIRIRRAGLNWSKKTFFIACTMTTLIGFMITALGFKLNLPLSLGLGLVAGFSLPHLYIRLLANRRSSKFSEVFPDAVDLIVRGLKAGLPLSDSIRMLSIEAQEPVRSEFKVIVEDLTIGVTMEDAVQRLWERVPLPETAFFGTVIALQSRTGGSLSEALANLSKVIRDRKKLQAKIRSMSAEAKASAGIIGCLPVAVCATVYVTSPGYMEVLFTTTAGQLVIGACLTWMTIGVLVMRKMIRFNY